MSGTFEEVGYLSSEMEAFREGARSAYSAEFAKLESSVRIALEDLRRIEVASGNRTAR